MFGSFKDAIAKFKSDIEAQVARHTNKVFLDAATAVTARISAADGNISDDEKQKMSKFMSIYPALKVFNATDVVTSWKKSADFYEFSKEMGDAEANKLISKVIDPEAQAVLVRLGCAIGAADGDFDDAEKAVTRDIIKNFGLRAADFGL